MKDLVSNGAIPVVASVASMSVLWGIFVVPVVGITPVVLLGVLMLAAALLVRMRSPQSTAQMIRDVESEPARKPVR